MVDFKGVPGGPEEPGKPAMAYVRASEVANGEQSMDDQKATIEAYATSHGLTLAGFLVEQDASGPVARSRPALAQLLKEVENNPGQVAAVLVVKFSRLSESVDEYETLAARLAEAGVTLVSVS